MRFLRRKSTEQTIEESPDAQSAEERERTHTPGKGRATPKRREAEKKRRGPVAPPPKTQREAIKRARGNKVNKEERRKASAERRARMMAGDDRYLMPRDRGPVRAHARDIVDSQRHLMGIFMPLVLVVFATTLVQNLVVQQYATLACMVLLLTMLFEGTVLGRRVNQRIRAKFPDAKDRPLALGWYAFTRAMQLRRLRVPRPRVSPTDANKVG